MPKRFIKGSGKKQPLNMRTTETLRKKLECAAGTSGRSLVQEVEHRVEQSFHKDEMLSELRRELRIIDRRSNLIYRVCERVDEMHEMLVLVTVLLHDKNLSIGEHDRLHALTSRYGLRPPTNGEAHHDG